MKILQVEPGPRPRTVRGPAGESLNVPAGWDLLPPGDAAATRRVKAKGPHWVMSRQKGRRRLGLGVWASKAVIAEVQAALAVEREDPSYQRKLEAGRARRAREQAAYVETFRSEVLQFLDFPLQHEDLAQALAQAVTEHATPVGSGTVARTKRISTERRAEAAVIAWLRHQTTTYDSMKIERVKGRRREVRRRLAERSRELLDRYRRGEIVESSRCPLRRALALESEGHSSRDGDYP
ncbi:MAG: DUF2293 domain-containing protein [Planctomycetota bacterium]